jgi:hypothetical protein
MSRWAASDEAVSKVDDNNTFDIAVLVAVPITTNDHVGWTRVHVEYVVLVDQRLSINNFLYDLLSVWAREVSWLQLRYRRSTNQL